MCAVLVYGVSFWLFGRLLLLLFADVVLGFDAVGFCVGFGFVIQFCGLWFVLLHEWVCGVFFGFFWVGLVNGIAGGFGWCFGGFWCFGGWCLRFCWVCGSSCGLEWFVECWLLV